MQSKFTAAILSVASLFFSVSIAHAQSNPIPLLNQPLVPGAAVPGGPTFTLTVNGTAFVPGAVVNWNSSPRSTIFLSGSQLTAQVDAADISSAQTASVTVTNPGTPSSNPSFFQVAFPASVLNFTRTDTPTGANPFNVATADLNGDGKPDLAIADSGANSVIILLGNGDGTFVAAATITVGSSPEGIAVGDFNGDGKADIAVANSGSNSISILLGNGDGTFQTATILPCGASPRAVAATDLNGDGRLDLATANFSDSTVSILLGNGDGTFEAHTDFATGSGPFSVAAADFNGDGHLDLAGSTGVGISILLGNGDGTFQAPVNYPAVLTDDLVVADFNGDGKLDIAATVVQPGSVDIFLGNGDGTFQSTVSYPTAGQAGMLVAGDFNGDSKVDLAINTNTNMSLLLGNGDGTFQPYASFPILGQATGISAADFNGDGLLDLVLTNFTANTVSIALQTTLVLSPSAVGFGAQGVLTTSRPQRVTLTNIGATAIPINSISITGANAGDFAEKSACGTSLAAGATCNISVTFTPPGPNSFTATLNLSDGAVGSPQQLNLSGKGALAKVTITPTILHFGNQTVGTTSPPQTVTLTVHNYPLALTSISFTGVNSSDFAESSNCPRQVTQGSSCQIRVTFTPSGTGTRSAKLVLKGAFPSGLTSVPVNGTGTN